MKPNWSKKWGREFLCPIAQKRLRPGKDKNNLTYVITTSCNHRFYRKALLEWYKTKLENNQIPTCPICRTHLNLEDFIK